MTLFTTFIYNLCCVLSILLPILIVILGRLQTKYDGSLSEKIDYLNGFKKQYNKHNVRFTIIWLLCIVFIITYLNH